MTVKLPGIDTMAKKVGELRILPTDDATRPQAMDIIHSMIKRVEVSEGVERSKPNVILVGDLAAILAYTQNNTAGIGDDGRVLMVAGTGLNEAPTITKDV